MRRGRFLREGLAGGTGGPHLSARRGTGIFEDAAVAAKQRALRGELAELAKGERALEQLLQDCALQLRQLTDHEDNQRYPCPGRFVAAGGWGTPPSPVFFLPFPLHGSPTCPWGGSWGSLPGGSAVGWGIGAVPLVVLLFFVVFSYTSSLPTLAYVTYQDLRTISSFQEQTVIAVKAPPETRLEVPDFSEVCVGPGAVPQQWGRCRDAAVPAPYPAVPSGASHGCSPALPRELLGCLRGAV